MNNVKFLGYPQTKNSNQLRHVSKHKMANCNNRAIEIVSKLNLENDFETDMDNDCQYNSYANDDISLNDIQQNEDKPIHYSLNDLT